MNIHKQDKTNREEGLESIMESMYAPKSEDNKVCPKCGKQHTINAGCGVAHESDDYGREFPDEHEPVTRVGDVASGDPRQYKIGQILKAWQTGDDLDGMIVDIYEEDGEIEFALMEIGEAGWSVRASEIKFEPSVEEDNGAVCTTCNGQKFDAAGKPCQACGGTGKPPKSPAKQTSTPLKRQSQTPYRPAVQSGLGITPRL